MGVEITTPNFFVSYLEFILTQVLQDGSLARIFMSAGAGGQTET